MDFTAGMTERAPGLGLNLGKFVEKMGSWRRHWFVLVSDRQRTREGRPAYLLTPAVEKYVEEFGGSDDLLSPFVGHSALPAVLPSNAYLASSYVPYLRGSSKTPDTSVGHADIPQDAGAQGHGSEFVFTATMNGCAFAVTGSEQQGHFTAWHYQSPGSNRARPAISAVTAPPPTGSARRSTRATIKRGSTRRPTSFGTARPAGRSSARRRMSTRTT